MEMAKHVTKGHVLFKFECKFGWKIVEICEKREKQNNDGRGYKDSMRAEHKVRVANIKDETTQLWESEWVRKEQRQKWDVLGCQKEVSMEWNRNGECSESWNIKHGKTVNTVLL